MYIGLDIGTTSLSAVVLDSASGQMLARHAVPNRAGTTPAPGRAELDLPLLYDLAVDCLAGVVAGHANADAVRGIGITGQQHGVALIGPHAEPAGPAITWQDQRVQGPMDGDGRSYLDNFIARAGGVEAFRSTGCLPAAGFLGTSLFWLEHQGLLPAPPALACFVPDAVGAFLTGSAPVCDPTNAASSGVFDILENQWDWALLERLGLPTALFASVGQAGETLGGLRRTIAERVGLPAGVPVGIALGDNQASFIGSVADPARSLLVNVGTGGQISARTEEAHFIPGLENRPFPGGRFLLIGGGLFGGRSYAYLLSFYRQVGRELFGVTGEEELYDRITELAAQAPAGSDGLRCQPLFTGSRTDPNARASFSGLSPQNFTPGHLARALLEGMADGFHRFYEQMLPVVGERSPLVGAGNGVRRNPLLARILAARFSLPLHLPALAEEAAVGAALVAATAAAEFADLDTAARHLLKYSDVIEPQAN